MRNITAHDVASLRKETGAGMMDCKKALETCSSYDEARGFIRGQEQAIYLNKFTRVECISNQLGREFVKYCLGNKLTMSVQDSGKTLKLFIDEEE